MNIDINNSQYYYDLFYQISFVVILFIYFIEGFKNKYPWSTWLLVIVTVRMFTIIGSKLGAVTLSDLNYFSNHLQFPTLEGKNLVGALIFGLIGIGFSKLALKIKYPILDTFAIAVPFGMAIQRIGCLLVGCCYGTETYLPWGIHYGTNSPVFYHQVLNKQINITDTLSLSVHPVQLYLILSYLLIGITLLLLRNRWKIHGNLALFGLALICATTFVIEFFRDPQSNAGFQGVPFLGMKLIQIVYLVVFIILSFLIYFREKKGFNKAYIKEPNHPLFNSLYLFILTLFIFTIKNWFTSIEFNVIFTVLILSAVCVCYQLFSHYYRGVVRFYSLGLLLFAILVMSQRSLKNDTISFQTFKFGVLGGNGIITHSVGKGEGCDRTSQSQDFNQKFTMGGAGYSYSEKKRNNIMELGINGYCGYLHEEGQISNTENGYSIFGLTPYAKYDWKWFGGGLGFHVGNLIETPFYWDEDNNIISIPQIGVKKVVFSPLISLRFGPEKYGFIRYRRGDCFILSPFSDFNTYLEIGSRFGTNNGFISSVGLNGYGGLVLQAKIPIAKQFILESNIETNEYSHIFNNYQASLTLSYLLFDKNK